MEESKRGTSILSIFDKRPSQLKDQVLEEMIKENNF